jgi:hypothetical protein
MIRVSIAAAALALLAATNPGAAQNYDYGYGASMAHQSGTYDYWNKPSYGYSRYGYKAPAYNSYEKPTYYKPSYGYSRYGYKAPAYNSYEKPTYNSYGYNNYGYGYSRYGYGYRY